MECQNRNAMKSLPYRKTKIIATLGPATQSVEMVGRLIESGVNVFRLNMSHADPAWVRQIVGSIRQLAELNRVGIGILMDTQGPSIRTGDVKEKIELLVGETFYFTVLGDTVPGEKWTSVGYDHFAADVNVGDNLIVDNGEIKMKIRSKTTTRVECEVLTEGCLGSRRHINLP